MRSCASRLAVDTAIDFSFEIGERQAVTASPVTEITEATQLVRAARDGDRAAFGQLYERYARMVHGILLARVPRHDVDDLVQDVFLLALRRLPTLRDMAAFGGWLATIARNRAHDYHRQWEDHAGLPEHAAESVAGKRSPTIEAVAILAAIRSLPETYRETLILRLVEGMTGPEIAARTGLQPGSVRVNLCRGMQQLREKLGLGSRQEDATVP